MPRMTQGNARGMVQRSLENFSKVTGEKVALVFSWHGTLCVLGNDKVKEFVTREKDEIWKSLAL